MPAFATTDALDNIILEHVLRMLPAAALAAAQLACKRWASLIMERQLWKPHALGQSQQEAAAAASPAVCPISAHRAWRHMALNRAAEEKWRLGQLALSATFLGHTQAIACIAVLQAEQLLISGSADTTARVWDLLKGTQLHLLRHVEPVVAVQLPSAALAVTATRSGAFLWRRGLLLRTFAVLPGCSSSCLGLADTRLLLGSSGATVQHFDLFSGSQQLITRHSSAITCMTVLQQHLSASDAEADQGECCILLGMVDGQVSCISSSTGQELWVLPNRYPSRVVALQVWYQAEQQQQQQQQQSPDMQLNLLYVLNARGQLICWRLPMGTTTACLLGNEKVGSSRRGSRAGPPGGDSTAVLGASSTAAGSTATGPLAAGLGARLSTCWPLAVSSLGRPGRVAAAAAEIAGTAAGVGVGGAAGTVAASKPSTQAMTAAATASNSYTCMLIPSFGGRCVLAGSSSGFISVAALQHVPPGSSGSSSVGDSDQQASPPSPHCTSLTTVMAAERRAGAAPEGLDGGTAAASTAAPSHRVRGQQQHRQHGDGGSSSSSSSDICCCLLPLQQRNLLVAEGMCSSACRSVQLHLETVASHTLQKLAVHLLKRYSAQPTREIAVQSRGSSHTGIGAAAAADVAMPAAESKVLCMTASASGQLIVGLGGGHVCVLKFKRRGICSVNNPMVVV